MQCRHAEKCNAVPTRSRANPSRRSFIAKLRLRLALPGKSSRCKAPASLIYALPPLCQSKPSYAHAEPWFAIGMLSTARAEPWFAGAAHILAPAELCLALPPLCIHCAGVSMHCPCVSRLCSAFAKHGYALPALCEAQPNDRPAAPRFAFPRRRGAAPVNADALLCCSSAARVLAFRCQSTSMLCRCAAKPGPACAIHCAASA